MWHLVALGVAASEAQLGRLTRLAADGGLRDHEAAAAEAEALGLTNNHPGSFQTMPLFKSLAKSGH